MAVRTISTIFVSLVIEPRTRLRFRHAQKCIDYEHKKVSQTVRVWLAFLSWNEKIFYLSRKRHLADQYTPIAQYNIKKVNM